MKDKPTVRARVAELKKQASIRNPDFAALIRESRDLSDERKGWNRFPALAPGEPIPWADLTGSRIGLFLELAIDALTVRSTATAIVALDSALIALN